MTIVTGERLAHMLPLQRPSITRTHQPEDTSQLSTDTSMVDSLASVLPRSFGAEQHDLATLPQFDAHYHTGMSRLLRMIALCWLASIPISYMLDQLFVARSAAPHSLPLLYYGLQMCPVLVVFGLAASPSVQRWLGRAFLPIVVCCMSVLPLLITLRDGLAGDPQAACTTAEDAQ